jgi:hypothetical protein
MVRLRAVGLVVRAFLVSPTCRAEFAWGSSS